MESGGGASTAANTIERWLTPRLPPTHAAPPPRRAPANHTQWREGSPRPRAPPPRARLPARARLSPRPRQPRTVCTNTIDVPEGRQPPAVPAGSRSRHPPPARCPRAPLGSGGRGRGGGCVSSGRPACGHLGARRGGGRARAPAAGRKEGAPAAPRPGGSAAGGSAAAGEREPRIPRRCLEGLFKQPAVQHGPLSASAPVSRGQFYLLSAALPGLLRERAASVAPVPGSPAPWPQCPRQDGCTSWASPRRSGARPSRGRAS